MTQHPSLKLGDSAGKYRSVIKRHEKIKELVEKDRWDEEKDSVYKLPKVKRVKFKVKKTKGPAEEEGAEGATAAVKEETAAARPEGKKDNTRKAK
ncbi:MAG: small basic protein [Candidatus Omnitrophica bacterium]|nr:small basic protein [Candidatus Omnitrophota bacterium]MBU1128757.1 small basic protein [Candidatus Omnitrophota bacterium]MBU1783982.1 small basic protein [Candidatus Omnitrophota bacterium]MBU1851250.1 small basic protein [Candidatus Omnitrophota bacterium]